MMGLEMRTQCEKCYTSFSNDSVAYICTHECTFCSPCVESFDFICPNCNGELVRRPKSRKAVTCKLNDSNKVPSQ